MRNEGLTKNFNAGGAVDPHRIVKFGASDTEVVVATNGAATMLGVTDSLGADAAGEPIDVIMDGIPTVIYGDTVTRGAYLTSDATGRAIPAVAANHVIGIAMTAGEAGDYGSVRIVPTRPDTIA